jgi:pyruvate kinase
LQTKENSAKIESLRNFQKKEAITLRKTKIICTIGPASDSEEVLEQLCRAGMNVARLNFSHGTHEEHRVRIDRIKRVREKLGLPIAILLDTKGPEYRIRTFKEGKVTLHEGDSFVFTTEEVEGDETRVSVSYKGLAKDLNVGDRILLSNGLLSFEVEETDGVSLRTRVLIGGELSNRKSMSFPGRVLKQDYMSPQDREDILFGIENDVDFIACSFVSCKEDLLAVRAVLDEKNNTDIDLIAKIENRAGIDNIESICEACDGIMIGRGDMGVEIPFEELPAIQKSLITTCRLLGKRVITATEMLESMIHNIRPTRAEISDVANAVYDGSSAIMLSDETAAGDHPALCVEIMAKIAETTEQSVDYISMFRGSGFRIKNTADSISHGTCGMAIDLDAKAIVVCSLSGATARMVSRFRAPVDILGLTTGEKCWRKLALSWGVQPVLSPVFDSTDVLFYVAKNAAKTQCNLKTGDRIVITGGITNGISGNTNLIKVDTI